MPKSKHGGRRVGSGRPPLPPERRMRRRQIGMLPADWAHVKALAAALGPGVSEDEIIRRKVRGEENPEFAKRVKSAGWASVAEFIEAVSSGKIKLPTRPEVLPGG